MKALTLILIALVLALGPALFLPELHTSTFCYMGHRGQPGGCHQLVLP